ncbi:amino acid permease [Streptomyces platensis]
MALWIPALAAVIVLIALNLPTVKAFGETEFWFALIKIVAIVALIVVGLVMVFGHFQARGGAAAGFSNLWNDGGFFPTGPMGFVAGFQIETFAFVGIELVGTTAAEAENPERNLPKAINATPPRGSADSPPGRYRPTPCSSPGCSCSPESSWSPWTTRSSRPSPW